MKLPRLIDPIPLTIPDLPDALRGLTILHLTDLHIRNHRAVHERLIDAVARVEHDILALTGDIMDDDGDEPVAFETTVRIVNAARPRLGAFGVHGNHDSHDLRRRLEHLPVHWLHNRAFVHESLPLSILGVECDVPERSAPRGDLTAALLDERGSLSREALRTGEGRGEGITNSPRFRLLLAHIPNWLPAAADASIDLMLSGHTHGGQVRLPGVTPMYNATPGWPQRHSTGLQRGGKTLCAISRGLGESYVDGFRVFCPPHAPLITLERGETAPVHASRAIVRVKHW